MHLKICSNVEFSWLVHRKVERIWTGFRHSTWYVHDRYSSLWYIYRFIILYHIPLYLETGPTTSVGILCHVFKRTPCYTVAIWLHVLELLCSVRIEKMPKASPSHVDWSTEEWHGCTPFYCLDLCIWSLDMEGGHFNPKGLSYWFIYWFYTGRNLVWYKHQINAITNIFDINGYK